MLNKIQSNKRLQLLIGFLIGIMFGFLLQKGGVTRYNKIMGQLLLEDFTVLKVIFTAILVGMIGFYLMKYWGLVQFHRKRGSVGSSVIGGLIFGVGFGILGYCPGTVAGAVGQGSLDALVGGFVGAFIGAHLFALMYPVLDRKILNRGDFGDITFPQLLKGRPAFTVFSFGLLLIFCLLVFEWVEK
jgi:uncharacterized protein